VHNEERIYFRDIHEKRKQRPEADEILKADQTGKGRAAEPKKVESWNIAWNNSGDSALIFLTNRPNPQPLLAYYPPTATQMRKAFRF